MSFDVYNEYKIFKIMTSISVFYDELDKCCNKNNDGNLFHRFLKVEELPRLFVNDEVKNYEKSSTSNK